MLTLLAFFFFYMSIDAQSVESSVHDVHVATMQIRYAQSEKQVQLICHFFIDDMEIELAEEDGEMLNFCTSAEIPDAESRLLDYLQRTCEISINGTSPGFKFIEKEISSDLMGMWCYFLIDDVSKPDSIEVRFEPLMDLYADQRNLVEVYDGHERIAYFQFKDLYRSDIVRLSNSGSE